MIVKGKEAGGPHECFPISGEHKSTILCHILTNTKHKTEGGSISIKDYYFTIVKGVSKNLRFVIMF